MLLVLLWISFLVTLKNSMWKNSFKLITYFENRRFNEGKFSCFSGLLAYLFLLGSTSLELFPLRFLNTINIGFILVVFIFSMGVGSSIGEIAFSTETGEISAFRIFPFPSFLGLHILYKKWCNYSHLNGRLIKYDKNLIKI